MIHLPALIDSSEKRFLQPLEDYFKTKYKEGYLISHGLDHHRRVWRYAKELLHQIYLQENNPESGLTDKLIIACYLHDIGMAFEQGEKHGLYSRSLVEEFLLINNLKKDDYLDVLKAVEHHDNKDYSGILNTNNIQKFLSAADDLDAFSYIGVYRYTEIYLARGVTPRSLGIMVRRNARNRFNNFSLSFGQYPDLVNKHKLRYYALDDFFRNQLLQLNAGQPQGNNRYSGYCGLVELISEIVDKRISFEEIFALNKIEYSTDPLMKSFINKIRAEWMTINLNC